MILIQCILTFCNESILNYFRLLFIIYDELDKPKNSLTSTHYRQIKTIKANPRNNPLNPSKHILSNPTNLQLLQKRQLITNIPKQSVLIKNPRHKFEPIVVLPSKPSSNIIVIQQSSKTAYPLTITQPVNIEIILAIKSTEINDTLHM